MTRRPTEDNVAAQGSITKSMTDRVSLVARVEHPSVFQIQIEYGFGMLAKHETKLQQTVAILSDCSSCVSAVWAGAERAPEE